RHACVVGAGPNGLTAAILLAKAGFSTTIFEAENTIGGGTRSAALTLPGFVHDVCSAVHPLAVSSPAFSEFPLREHGLQWIQPPIPLAHPLDDGSAAVLRRSVDETCSGFGTPDGETYGRIVKPMVNRWAELSREILQPVFHVPHNPMPLARFGWQAWQPAAFAARRLFRTAAAQALFAGAAAHSVLP